jgi:hypothetical protein
MNKVTLLPRPVERSVRYIDDLNIIADDLEERADSLLRHAMALRQHAEDLEAVAAVGRRSRAARKRSGAETVSSITVHSKAYS